MKKGGGVPWSKHETKLMQEWVAQKGTTWAEFLEKHALELHESHRDKSKLHSKWQNGKRASRTRK